MNMDIDVASAEPVYEQIVRQIVQGVRQGALAPGAPLPPIRQLARDLDLNQNTVAKAYKPGEWNQMHLVARGRTMTFSINGVLMSVFIDDHPTKFLPKGVLSIQLEGRGDNKAAFRNLWLKNY